MTQESKYLLCFTAKGLTHWYVIAILELPTVMTLMAYQTHAKADSDRIKAFEVSQNWAFSCWDFVDIVVFEQDKRIPVLF